MSNEDENKDNINEIVSQPTIMREAPAIIYEQDLTQKEEPEKVELKPGSGDFMKIPEKKEEQQPTQSEQLKEHVRKMPVEFTTEIIVDTIERLVNTPVFLIINARNKKKVFGDKEIFQAAQELSYLSQADLEKLPIDDQIYAKKYGAYKSKMEKIYNDLDFKPKQREKLSKPLAVMVREHNFDIPPWLAFSIALADILLDRSIDIFVD